MDRLTICHPQKVLTCVPNVKEEQLGIQNAFEQFNPKNGVIKSTDIQNKYKVRLFELGKLPEGEAGPAVQREGVHRLPHLLLVPQPIHPRAEEELRQRHPVRGRPDEPALRRVLHLL